MATVPRSEQPPFCSTDWEEVADECRDVAQKRLSRPGPRLVGDLQTAAEWVALGNTFSQAAAYLRKEEDEVDAAAATYAATNREK